MEVYSEPSQIYKMGGFCKTSKPLKAVNYFRKNLL